MALNWLRFKDSSSNPQTVSVAQPLPVQVTGASSASTVVDTELPAAGALNATIAKSVSAPVVGAGLLVSDGTNFIQPLGDATNGLDVDVTRVTGTVTVDSELAAAILAADGMANPTAPQVLAQKMVWNATTWDRALVGTGPSAGIDVMAFKSGSTLGDNNNSGVSIPADASASNRLIGVHNPGFNATTYDRWRNNVEGTALASAARTATTSSADIVNYNGTGILIIFNATAFAATPTLTVSVDAKDPVSANYVTITTFTALNIAGATTQAYTLYPGAAETVATANHEVQALALPRTFRITVTAGDTDSCTYSVGYTIIL